MKSQIISFCQSANLELKDSKDFAITFVKLRIEFFNKFNKNYIFSTRFGAEFFDDVLNRIINNIPIKADKGEKIGEYDVNFNTWLKGLN